MNRSATAYHEAAHAVILYRTTGHAHGERVTIVPDEDSHGHAAGELSDSFSAEDMEGRILSLYAGGHAQRETDPGEGDDGCAADDAQAEDVMREWGWEDREQEFREKALVLVRRHWSEIQAVADELLRVGTLVACEVEILADQAAGDPDADIDLYRRLWGDHLEQLRKRNPIGGARS